MRLEVGGNQTARTRMRQQWSSYQYRLFEERIDAHCCGRDEQDDVKPPNISVLRIYSTPLLSDCTPVLGTTHLESDSQIKWFCAVSAVLNRLR